MEQRRDLQSLSSDKITAKLQLTDRIGYAVYFQNGYQNYLVLKVCYGAVFTYRRNYGYFSLRTGVIYVLRLFYTGL